MNGTTKQRYISTSIWSDDWFDSLTEREKLVYFYLLTNEHSNAAGVYQCTLKNVRVEIGLNRDELEPIMEKFAKDGKAFYYKEYIIIPKWLKHQKVNERSKMFLGAIKVIKSLPKEIQIFISDRKHYDFDIYPYISKNPKSDSLSEKTPKNDIDYQEKDENYDSLSKNDTENGKGYTENSVQTPHDSDSEFDSEFEFDINSGGSEFLKRLDTSPPPQDLIQKIKALAIHVGFAVDDELAKHLSSGAYNPEWFSRDDLSFLHFVYSRITATYTKKTNTEKRCLLFSALWNRQGKWSDLSVEYPIWREKKIKEQQDHLQNEQKTKSKPSSCKCGSQLSTAGKCPDCGSWFEWQNDSWVFIQAIEIPKNFFEKITKSHIPKAPA